MSQTFSEEVASQRTSLERIYSVSEGTYLLVQAAEQLRQPSVDRLSQVARVVVLAEATAELIERQ